MKIKTWIKRAWYRSIVYRLVNIIKSIIYRQLMNFLYRFDFSETAFKVDGWICDLEGDEGITNGVYPLWREYWLYLKLGMWEPGYWHDDHDPGIYNYDAIRAGDFVLEDDTDEFDPYDDYDQEDYYPDWDDRVDDERYYGGED